MSEPVTSKDFQLLIKEVKKTNEKLDEQSKSGFVASIKGSINDLGDTIKKPFESAKNIIQKPFDAVSDTIDNIGKAAMKPFESFKNVSQGFKNIFKKDESQLQTELLEKILVAVKEQTKAFKGNDLKQAEEKRERFELFEDIRDSLDDIEPGSNQLAIKGKDGGSGGITSGILDLAGDLALARLIPGMSKGKGLLGKGKNLAGGILKRGKGAVLAAGGLLAGVGKMFSKSPSAPKVSPSTPKVSPSTPKVPSVSALPAPAKTIIDAGKAGQGAATSMMKNITNAPGSSVVDVPKAKGGFLSKLNPIKRIKDSAKGLAKGFPSILKKVPVIGGVVEGIFLNSAINQVLEDPETSDDEKKQLVGAEFIKALTGPAGAAIAIGAVGALTGGTGFLASAVTGAAGYSIGKVVGGVLASVLPSKQIGGAIINTFYKKKSSETMNKESQTTDSMKAITTDSKEKRFDSARITAKETQAALTKFESENKDAEMIEVENPDADFDEAATMMVYKDSEKQAQFEKLRTEKFEAQRKSRTARDELTGTGIGDKINFLKNEGIELPGLTYGDSVVDPTTGQVTYNFQGKTSGMEVDSALDKLFMKESNTTGVDMLNQTSQTTDSMKAITTDSKEKAESVTDSMKNVRTNSAEKQIKALKSFESDETKGEYTFAEIDGIGYRRKYKDPEAQKEYEKILYDKSQLTKNVNTTGVDMLNQTSQISDIKSSQENKESAAPVIAADNSSRNNVVNTTINEAPNHIDRTKNLFGTPSVAY